MIYSRWNYKLGGYDYFQTSEQHGIGDDYSAPLLSQSSPIGVASVDAGRPLPISAKFVGTGKEARGLLTPVSRSVLGAIQSVLPKETLFFAAGLLTMWCIFRIKKR